MLKLKFVRCVLKPPYSNAARQRLEYFESILSKKIAFSGSERVYLKGIKFREF